MSMNSPVRVAGHLEEPQEREKKLSAAVHLISIFSPLWGPLIGWAIFRNSLKFVAAHSWAALVEFLVLKAALLVMGVISLGFTIWRVVEHSRNNWENFSWGEVILRLGITWVFLLILGAVTSILSVRQALRAYHGHWPNRDVKKALRASNGAG